MYSLLVPAGSADKSADGLSCCRQKRMELPELARVAPNQLNFAELPRTRLSRDEAVEGGFQTDAPRQPLDGGWHVVALLSTVLLLAGLAFARWTQSHQLEFRQLDLLHPERVFLDAALVLLVHQMPAQLGVGDGLVEQQPACGLLESDCHGDVPIVLQRIACLVQSLVVDETSLKWR